MEKEKLKKMFRFTATNFKFKLDEDFSIFFEMIYEKVKNIPDDLIIKRFQQLWLRSTDEWNKEYGFAGYPSFADWIFILTGSRALTDVQIEEKKKSHDIYLKRIVSNVAYRTDSKYDEDGRVFANYYLESEDCQSKETRDLVNKFYNITTALTYDEARELGLKIRKEKEKNWDDLKSKLLEIAKNQNQLLIN
jgi:hypothetical protein